jgi:hypothetical protein
MIPQRLQQWIRSLEEALNLTVEVEKPSTPKDTAEGLPVEVDGTTYFLRLPEGLSPREERLIRMLLTAWEEKRHHTLSPVTSAQRQLVDWLINGETASPPAVASQWDWSAKVPLYIALPMGADDENQGLAEAINGYFDGQAGLFSLSPTEMLVTVSMELIGGEEEGREALCEGAQGLADMLISEAGQDVTLSIHTPLTSAEELPGALHALRDTYRVGNLFYPRRRVHASWQYSLERLLVALPETDAQAYLTQLAPVSFWEDRDLRETVEAFLEQNLNVSETARQLYIHRNTLIYRLDRLKKETGLDVRRLDDALKVRLALLLRRRLAGKE